MKEPRSSDTLDCWIQPCLKSILWLPSFSGSFPCPIGHLTGLRGLDQVSDCMAVFVTSVVLLMCDEGYRTCHPIIQ